MHLGVEEAELPVVVVVDHHSVQEEEEDVRMVPVYLPVPGVLVGEEVVGDQLEAGLPWLIMLVS